MACEKIGEPVKSVVAEPCEYHHALLVNDHIWLFGRTFVNQPSHNWGHRVALAGTYAVAFDTVNKKWGEPLKFGALSEEENVSEALFVLNNTIFMLLFSAFGELSMKSVHKWNGSAWESSHLESFATIPGGDPSVRVTVVVADGPHNDSKYLISTVGHQIRVAHLKLTANGISITHVLDVPDSAATTLAQAVCGVESGDRLLIGYGVHGCGFRWEKSHVIACDPVKKTCENCEVTSENAPKWGFNGAFGRYLTTSGAWIHAAGSVPHGMTGSVFDGSIWAMKDLTSTPKWHQLQGTVPAEGNVVIGQGRVFSVDDNGVHSISLAEN
ncbi:unnamed protein product [Nippostrongylus brasiliensis]|uniref:RCC1/BLIP-II n=1 Tax=Nippostrongylus brasiliensis TaxID=27835 RepID=A0A0N4XSX4_NIPBR|nr:unnamed protein product [Nippostrongylus brasiliensis]